jgi:hypothetical protein
MTRIDMISRMPRLMEDRKTRAVPEIRAQEAI